MLINEKVIQKYISFSKKQKKIADYLLEHYNEMGFMTLKRISAGVGVTEVTVINFCKALGFRNFMEMKEAYRNEITTIFAPTKKIFSSFREGDENSQFLSEIIEKHVQNHEKTLLRLDEDSLFKTVELLRNAGKVFIFCRGLPTSVAAFFALRLESLAIKAELVDVGRLDNRFFMGAMRFTGENVYIFLSYPVYSKALIKFCEYFNKKGFSTISMTDKPDSPITEFSDICFFTDNDSHVFFNSYQPLISVIEIILVFLHNSLKDRLLNYLDKVAEMEKEFEGFVVK